MMNKPLGYKSYGHIPHMIGSRMGPTDKHCERGQQDIVTKKVRDWKDLIIVQEKVDGCNMSVVKLNGEIIALGRAGYEAFTSPFEQQRMFGLWVNDNKDRFNKLLYEGERIVGEWLIQACGTRYNLPHEPYVVFDLMKEHIRLTYHSFLKRVLPLNFIIPRLIHIGQPLKLDKAKEAIRESGHGALDEVEGVVYRCERNSNVDFLCKWVRPDKEDGKYLPEKNNGKEVWNVEPELINNGRRLYSTIS